MAASAKSKGRNHLEMPSIYDVDDFTKKVEEASILIDGLSKGTISPAYVDSKLVKEAIPQPPSSNVAPARDEQEVHDFESRKDSVQKKVEEIKTRIEMKQRARRRYEEHIKTNAPTLASTDYIKWDIWCPEDDEDELLASCTPNNAQLRAMEKDINDRHARMVKDRQRAERCRQAGIASYSNKQWAQAYIHFEEGCNADRSNPKLHSNAAMASIKMGCYAQAIEHCEKVIRLHEFLLDKPEHPMVVKAWQRMAAARVGLQHFKEAAEAMEAALMVAPDNFDIIRAAQQVQRAYDEQKVVKGLTASKETMKELQKLESLSCALAAIHVRVHDCSSSCKSVKGVSALPPTNASLSTTDTEAVSVSRICDDMISMLHGHEDWLVYFRSCGGLKSTACQLARYLSLWNGKCATSTCKASDCSNCESTITCCAELLNVACQVDTNGHVLSGCVLGEPPGQKQRLSTELLCKNFLSQCCMAAGSFEGLAVLLHTLTTDEQSRQRVATAFLSKVDVVSDRSAIDDIFEKLQKLKPIHQSILVSLLSNCMTVYEFAASVSEELGAGRHATTLQMLLQKPTSPATCELAANLLANSSTYPKMRSALACDSMLQTLTCHCSQFSGCGANQAETKALKACLTCLYNLGLERDEGSISECLNSESWFCLVAKLFQHEDTAVAQLAACVEARHVAAIHADSTLMSQLLSTPLINMAFEAGIATEIMPRSEISQPNLRLWQDRVALKAIDAVMRILAGLGAAGHIHVLKTSSAVALLSWACCTKAVMDGCAGNAALCIGYIADDKSLVSVFKDGGVVNGLVEMAHKRHGTPASRNAAIAAAKLAQDPSCLQQMRECHGFEKIHSYVTV